jgi:ElaB/YqjD/DUF883 family membrane-anchored ribosome-binding protein
MQDSKKTRAILRRMEEVRCDLDEGAQEIAESARDMGEWRYYVRNYPWVSVGAACVIGYTIIPRRRLGYREVNRTLDELVDYSRLLTQEHPTSTTGVRNSVLMFAGNLLWRSALSFATRQAVQYFATQSAKLPSEEQS